MVSNSNRVCPVELADSLDTKFRRWFQNPQTILHPFIREGMTVLDFGCGPGFFTISIARMVGSSGHVIAADLQPGMLQKLEGKIRGTELATRITLHLCQASRIGLDQPLDFALAFYVVHELGEPEAFFQELISILTPGGNLLLVEPPFHVSRRSFRSTLEKAYSAGFEKREGPRIFLNRTAILKRPDEAQIPV